MFWKRMADRKGFPASRLTPPVVRGGDQLKGRPLGRVLVRMGKVTREQVMGSLIHQKEHGGLLGEVMVKLGFVQLADILAALAGQRGERP